MKLKAHPYQGSDIILAPGGPGNTPAGSATAAVREAALLRRKMKPRNTRHKSTKSLRHAFVAWLDGWIERRLEKRRLAKSESEPKSWDDKLD